MRKPAMGFSHRVEARPAAHSVQLLLSSEAKHIRYAPIVLSCTVGIIQQSIFVNQSQQ